MKARRVQLEDGIFYGTVENKIKLNTKYIESIVKVDVNGFACDENIFIVVFDNGSHDFFILY